MAICTPDICELLEWDTTFFGFRICRVQGDTLTQKRVHQINAWCQQNDINCLYFLANPEDALTTRIAEDNGFRLVDVRMTFALRVSGLNYISESRPTHIITVRQALPEDIDMLGKIARESHKDSRFFYDENFPKQLSELLYETWIKNSCEGYADVVLVAVSNRMPVGYISCHLGEEDHAGSIGLVGVSKSARGSGIGQILLSNALEWFIERETREITVVTQGRNCTAQRLYQRFGFLTQKVQLWYHKWYTISGETYG